ncbi:nuclear transport factor 2 family protein [Streptomyces sp. NPDC090499]|uniref:nuclear transport factor 2 family protein n=1 Tax=Streptomyces sp. NPDC090499 TaxID=3365965 RepID=UPI0038012630
MTEKLEDAADHVALTELVHRYAHHVHGHSDRDAELTASCFTEDAVFVFDGGEPLRVSDLGLGAMSSVDPAVMRRTNGLDRIDASSSATTNVSVELHGDTATVESLAITTLVGQRDGAPAMRVRGIGLRDEAVRVDGEWKIARRGHDLLWAFAPTPVGPGE